MHFEGSLVPLRIKFIYLFLSPVSKNKLYELTAKKLFTMSMSHPKLKELNETAEVLLDMFIVLDKQKAIMHYWSLLKVDKDNSCSI